MKNVSVSGKAVNATLQGLHPSYMYNIKIRARNAVGLGLPSHQVSARMLEEGRDNFHHQEVIHLLYRDLFCAIHIFVFLPGIVPG